VGVADRPGFYLGLLRFAWHRTPATRRPRAAALLLLTQLATACGYGVERVRRAP
jgi:hypothetical protein